MRNEGTAKNVYLWGIFDVLHEGHRRLFEEAAKLGDLHVIVVSDERSRHKRLLNDEETRRKNVAASPGVKVAYVDALPGITCFDAAPPDIFCFGYDQNREWNDKMKETVLSKFPACSFVTMDKYSNTHSTDLKENFPCHCGSGKLWKECHALNG